MLDKINDVSKTLIVGIISIELNENDWDKSLLESIDKLNSIKVISKTTSNIKIAIEEVSNEWDILIGIGESIDELRKRALEFGYHQIFWSLNINNKDNIFIGFNQSDFSSKISPLITKTLSALVKEIKAAKGEEYACK